MKISKLFLALVVLGWSFLFAPATATAASYDIKEDVVQTTPAVIADRASVTADKVMEGITDITLTLVDDKSKKVQRILLQCDATQQTITAFYYLNDVLGGKAKGATGFQINVYGNAEDGYKHGGDVTVFDSTKIKDNLRTGINRLKKLNGVGFISFEFFETHDGIDHNPIAHSFLLSSNYLPKILEAMDKYPGSQGCSIDGGFTSVYPLKNLKDSI